jgi:hypothetical protein
VSDFETGDCGGLGTLLKRDPVPNSCFIFDINDWLLSDGECKTYYIDFDPTGVDKANISVQEMISVSSYVEVGAYITHFTGGDFRLDVSCDPDCRFNGRVIVDG